MNEYPNCHQGVREKPTLCKEIGKPLSILTETCGIVMCDGDCRVGDFGRRRRRLLLLCRGCCGGIVEACGT